MRPILSVILFEPKLKLPGKANELLAWEPFGRAADGYQTFVDDDSVTIVGPPGRDGLSEGGLREATALGITDPKSLRLATVIPRAQCRLVYAVDAAQEFTGERYPPPDAIDGDKKAKAARPAPPPMPTVIASPIPASTPVAPPPTARRSDRPRNFPKPAEPPPSLIVEEDLLPVAEGAPT